MRHRSSVGLVALAAVAFLAPPAAAQQQEAVITGKVTSEAGAPLSSASVFVEELRAGTLTGDDGSYRIIIPGARATGQQVTLSVRLIGYKEASVKLALTGGPHTQNFSLAANPLRLGEVVVTGEGLTTTRERLGNVINTVDSSLIRRSDETNVIAALSAKAPNVEVNSSSGDPGASAYIRIRGPKTISGDGQPLIVVDGVPIDNSTISSESPLFGANAGLAGTAAPNRASDINPDDIASIEVLKGAGAAAIYGARAGQGVVLITTKSGHSGPTRYSLRSSYSFDDVNRSIPLNTEYGHGINGVTPGCDSRQSPILDCNATSNSWGPLLPAGTPVYNHFDELFTTGHNWNSSLSISGGNDRTLYYVSGERDNDAGDIVGPNDWYHKSTARVNASHQVFDNLKVGLDLSYVDARGHFVQQGSNVDGLLLGALRTPPEFNNMEYLDPTSHLQRSYRFPWPSISSQFDSRNYDNPVWLINQQLNTSNLERTYGNVNVSYQPLDWLTLKEVFGADYYTDERLEGFPYTSSAIPQGEVLRADFKNYQLDQNLTATAQHTFTPDFTGSLTLGQNANSRSFRQVSVQGISLIAAQPFSILNTVAYFPNDFQSLVHSESYFAQASVYLWNQLDLTGAARYDGYSSFGTSSRYHWFPKASLAWTFVQNAGNGSGILTYGKLRGAYGETGTEPTVYITNQIYTSGGFFGDNGWGDALFQNQNGVGGLSQGASLAQPNLGPERTKEIEVGTDLGLFDNHADFSATLYQDRTEGAIFSLPLPNSTGFVQQANNAGTIRNRGVELSANYRPIMRSDLTWEIGAQWSKNENRVLDLHGQQFVDLATGGGFTGAVPTVWQGYAVGVLRGDDFVRCGRGVVLPDGTNVDQACGSAPKGALYLDGTGFPLLDQTQRVIADGNPDWLGSVRTSVTWNKVTVSGLLDIKHGGQIWDGTRGALYNFGAHRDTDIRDSSVVFGKTWMPGPVAGPGAGQSVVLDQNWFLNLGGGFNGPSAEFVEPGGYTKLRELSVAYSFDQPWVKNMGFSTIDLRLSGRNLYTWTKYRGIDPEANLAGATTLIQDVDYFNNPQTRSFVISVGLNK